MKNMSHPMYNKYHFSKVLNSFVTLYVLYLNMINETVMLKTIHVTKSIHTNHLSKKD